MATRYLLLATYYSLLSTLYSLLTTHCVLLHSLQARPGMCEYVAWQNSLRSPEEMAAARFIEIPALHQTAIFRRAAIDEVLAGCAPPRYGGRGNAHAVLDAASAAACDRQGAVDAAAA